MSGDCSNVRQCYPANASTHRRHKRLEVFTKPILRIPPEEWQRQHEELAESAKQERENSTNIRFQGKYLKNEVDNRTKWDTIDNTQKLATRFGQERGWKYELEKCLTDIDEEIDLLTRGKEDIEDGFNFKKKLGIDIARQCLTLRDMREDGELTEDGVDTQLRTEIDIIEDHKDELQQKINESFEHLCRLQEARQTIMDDLRDKRLAMNIDDEVHDMTEYSSGLSLKPDPTAIPADSLSVAQWFANSQRNREYANRILDDARRVRSDLDASCIQRQDDDLEFQYQRTEFDFRKRIHDEIKAKEQLEFEKKETEKEIMDLEEDIKSLEDSLRAKLNPLKLAHTRLETRKYRPNNELIVDEPQYGLIQEVTTLENNIQRLEAKTREHKGKLNELQRQLGNLDIMINRKKKTIQQEEQCLDSRKRLLNRPPHLQLMGMPKSDTKPRALYAETI